MPRFAKSSEDRWLHPSYRKAYCYRYRNGMVYTCVNSVRQSTGFEWNLKDKLNKMFTFWGQDCTNFFKLIFQLKIM